MRTPVSRVVGACFETARTRLLGPAAELSLVRCEDGMFPNLNCHVVSTLDDELYKVTLTGQTSSALIFWTATVASISYRLGWAELS